MAKREPKSRFAATVHVVDRSGGTKGKLELSSGNLTYYRQNAKSPTISLTYQQLLSLLEDEVDFRSIIPGNYKFPGAAGGNDFNINVFDEEETDGSDFIISSTISMKKFDKRRLEQGNYQFGHDMAAGRGKKSRYNWTVQVSVQAALWIIGRYIDNLPLGSRSNHIDEDAVISRDEMRHLLLVLLAKIET